MKIFFTLTTILFFLTGAGCTSIIKPTILINPTNSPTTTPPKSSLSVQPSQPPAVPREMLVNYINQPDGYAFTHTSQVAVQPTGEGIRLVHAVPFVHEDPCDQKDGRTLSLLTDFELTLQTVPTKQLGEWVKKSFGPEFLKESFKDNRFVPDNDVIKAVAFGGNKGVEISVGVEWCGENTYVFPLTNTTTLIATQPFGTPIDGGFDPEVKAVAEKLVGVILPTESEGLKKNILASITTNVNPTGTFRVIRLATGSEAIIQNTAAPFSFQYPADWALKSYRGFYDAAGSFTFAPNAETLFLPTPAPRLFDETVHFESNEGDSIYEETYLLTKEIESARLLNGITWNLATFRRLPDGPQDEHKIIGIATSPKNPNWGYKVGAYFYETHRAEFMRVYERLLSTFAEQL